MYIIILPHILFMLHRLRSTLLYFDIIIWTYTFQIIPYGPIRSNLYLYCYSTTLTSFFYVYYSTFFSHIYSYSTTHPYHIIHIYGNLQEFYLNFNFHSYYLQLMILSGYTTNHTQSLSSLEWMSAYAKVCIYTDAML